MWKSGSGGDDMAEGSAVVLGAAVVAVFGVGWWLVLLGFCAWSSRQPALSGLHRSSAITPPLGLQLTC